MSTSTFSSSSSFRWRTVARAAKLLLHSLDGEVDDDTEERWAAEIERRLARIDAGEAKLLSMDEALARLRRAARGR